MPGARLLVSGCLALAALVSSPMNAEADRPVPSHPEPSMLEDMALTDSFTLGRPFSFQWVRDGSAVLFLRSGARDRSSDLFELDLATGTERLRVSAAALLAGREEQLSVAEKAERERKRIKTAGFTGFELSADGRRVVLKLSGKLWLHERDTGRTARLALPAGVVLDPRLSPDGKRLAFVLDWNLWVMKLGPIAEGATELEGKVVALTRAGSEARPFGVAEFVAQEEMHRFQGYWWAPDGKRLLVQRTDQRHLERLTIADAARPESSAQVFPYPRAGKANAEVRLFVVPVDGGKKTEVAWDREAFPYLAHVAWSRGAPPSLLVQSRRQDTLRFLRADPATGRTVTMHEESDPAWLNLLRSVPAWLPDGGSYLWATEEGGAWRLERHWPRPGAKKGGLLAREVLLEPDAGFAALAHVDADRGLVWFLGGPSPVETHLYRASLAGKGEPQRISPAGGEHGVAFSPDGGAFVLTRGAIAELPRATVHRTDALAGALALEDEGPAPRAALVRAVAETPRWTPRVELVPPERAGGFHAAIVRPRNLEPGKKYPVIQYVYGGPGFQVVKDAMAFYFMEQWMADHGFVVVSLDGRGTPRRGREHERALRGRFGSVPLEDQVAGLRALGEHYPELDLSRVGVYGWSFGGYLAALSVMKRPDVYRAAVAGAPVADWRYYDTHYTERYLGLPDEAPEAYREASLLTHAPALERPLLLVHGIADDNVYFAHSLQLADTLFRNRRRFELLPLVGLTHQVADPKVRETLYERIVEFLARALW